MNKAKDITDPKTAAAVDKWYSMTTLERVEVIHQVKHCKSVSKTFRLCIEKLMN